MLEYDNPILHTNLWEEFDNQPWEPLVESKDKWKSVPVPIRKGDTNNTFHSGYREQEFHEASRFITQLRADRLKKLNMTFPYEISIGFVNEKTLDKVEFLAIINDYDSVTLEVTTSQATVYNQLKTVYSYKDYDQDPEPETDSKKQNALTWKEKTIRNTMSLEKCRELCQKAFSRLRVKRFREIKKDENLWDLVKKNETYRYCIIDIQKFNEVFHPSINIDRINEAEEEYIADDIDFPIPGRALDFNNFKAFLTFISPQNLLNRKVVKEKDYPLDVYIQFASHENGRIACIWVAYSGEPADRVKNTKVTLFSAVPYIYRRDSNNKSRVVIKTIRDKKDILAVIKSDDLYIDWNTSRKHYDTTAKDAYQTVRNMILKLLGSSFSIFLDGTDIIEFVTEKPELSTRPKPQSPGRGRPKGSTKPKW